MHGINASSSAALYGKGVFSTIAIRDGKPFLWEKHWRRLTANANALSIELSEHSEPGTLAALMSEIDDLAEGRARITFFDESPSAIWPFPGAPKINRQIVISEPRVKPESFRLTISSHRLNSTSPLAGIKSCNYLEHLMALERATASGFDEAVRVNELGFVASGCMANVFWVRDGRLYTPSLSTGCVPGTTREYVLENVESQEVEAGIEELEAAEQMFLTSAGLGIAAVAEFDGRKLAAQNHSIIDLLGR